MVLVLLALVACGDDPVDEVSCQESQSEAGLDEALSGVDFTGQDVLDRVAGTFEGAFVYAADLGLDDTRLWFELALDRDEKVLFNERWAIEGSSDPGYDCESYLTLPLTGGFNTADRRFNTPFRDVRAIVSDLDEDLLISGWFQSIADEADDGLEPHHDGYTDAGELALDYRQETEVSYTLRGLMGRVEDCLGRNDAGECVERGETMTLGTGSAPVD